MLKTPKGVEGYMLKNTELGGYMLKNTEAIRLYVKKHRSYSVGGYMLKNTEAIILYVEKHRSYNLFYIIFPPIF